MKLSSEAIIGLLAILVTVLIAATPLRRWIWRVPIQQWMLQREYLLDRIKEHV